MLERWCSPKFSAISRAGSIQRGWSVKPRRRPFFVRPTAIRTRPSVPVRQSTDTSGSVSSGITSQSTGSSVRRRASSTRSSGTYGLGNPPRCSSEKGERVTMRKPMPPAPVAGLKHALCPAASSASTAARSSSADRTRDHGGTGTPSARTASYAVTLSWKVATARADGASSAVPTAANSSRCSTSAAWCSTGTNTSMPRRAHWSRAYSTYAAVDRPSGSMAAVSAAARTGESGSPWVAWISTGRPCGLLRS